MELFDLYNIYKQYPKICIDSRKIIHDSIFFALKGDSFDGNDYAQIAIDKGCKYAIIDNPKKKINNNYIVVENVLDTLQKLANYHRRTLSIPIIGITGTNGKTTSKELINCVLKKKFKTYCTAGNFNNHIGVPLSLLEISKKHEIAIIEMGANNKNDIKFLCKIAEPEYGIITNIGKAHLKGFKNIDGVIRTKKEIYDYIKDRSGKIFINKANNILTKISQNIDKISYDSSKYKIKETTPFLKINYSNTIIKTHLIGNYQKENILLAIRVGEYFKINFTLIKKAVFDYIPQNNRSQIIKTKKNFLILDAYNANPSSTIAMLESFQQQKYSNKLCILGDMLELGTHSSIEHKNIVRLTKKLKIAALFIGKEFKKVHSESFSSLNEAIEFIKEKNIKDKTILLKGSRGVRLEELIDYL